MLKLASDTSHMDIVENAYRRKDLLKERIQRANSESDVRQAFLSLFELDTVGNLEVHRVDYSSKELMAEFKYDVDLGNIRNKCKVLAQLLHYLHNRPMAHKKYDLPDSICLVDKYSVVFYDTKDFVHKYILEDKYFKDIERPSSTHELLETDLSRDICSRGKSFIINAEYSEIYDELVSRGVYD